MLLGTFLNFLHNFEYLTHFVFLTPTDIDGLLRPQKPLKNADNFMFLVLFSNILFYGSSEDVQKEFIHESESILYKLFCINFNLNF